MAVALGDCGCRLCLHGQGSLKVTGLLGVPLMVWLHAGAVVVSMVHQQWWAS
jgi:hypothetical protein